MGEATEGGHALSQHHKLLRENLIIPKWIKAKLLLDFLKSYVTHNVD